ncbi:SDR family oxidoreductase [Argonema antarcticum]|uniref:SDR family oxidoreductase n=1 Tax=Argonema antarcticum TaxID=2942763 RepID=UPI002011CA63|nr:SDR family oxidoreductase [Argonema antarcticum]MCL1474447.1 SDR family oxidoreductase [Argonema antarcticum A004/B2]
MQKLAVFGGTGIIGRSIIEYLDTQDDWQGIGVARHKQQISELTPFVELDLLQPFLYDAALEQFADVTHAVYAAYVSHEDKFKENELNIQMFQGLMQVLQNAAPNLKRVILMQGVKAYGVHLGAFKTPAKETDPRHLPPNFYYDQEDILKETAKQQSWEFTILRPDVVCGFSIGTPMSIVLVIAVYAEICRFYGLPMRFPGKVGAYNALAQVTDAELLAKAVLWAATEPRAAGETYNITNGDLFRWKYLWAQLADYLEMQVAEPQTISLSTMMADKAPIWQEIQQRYSLKPVAFKDLAAWWFGDFIFGCDYDVISDTTKIKLHGFKEIVDTSSMFARLLDRYRLHKVLPVGK